MKFAKTLAVAFLLTPLVALATSENANQNGGTQNENVVRTTSQAQVNNPDIGIQTQTRTTEQIQLQTQQDAEAIRQQYQVRSATAGSRSSEVAKAVEGMLTVANRLEDPTIGERIREIAKGQNEAEDRVNEIIDDVQQRSAVAKFFIGANFGQIKEAKKIMEQNQARVRELQQTMLQLNNEADQSELQNQISTLTLQNLNLANQLQEEGKGFSLLGWLIRWFYGV